MCLLALLAATAVTLGGTGARPEREGFVTVSYGEDPGATEPG